MIAHVVLFSPRANLSLETRRELLGSITAAARGIQGVRRFRVGRRITHGVPGYEEVMRDDYEYAAIVEFDDLDGLKAYLAHPAHVALGEFFTSQAARSLAYDYEMMDADEPLKFEL
jgi:hypothetical protein